MINVTAFNVAIVMIYCIWFISVNDLHVRVHLPVLNISRICGYVLLYFL